MGQAVAVIPARWKSSRFPGKPIIPLLGVPMIVRVWERVKKASLVDRIILATDDERIAKVAEAHGMEISMTSENCFTGTDRVAEVARKIDAEIYVNVQGDEPLLEPDGIDAIIRGHKEFIKRGIEVTNAYVPENELPFQDKSVHAFLTKTIDNQVLGLSRNPIPFFFKSEVIRNSHVGMYAFSRKAVIQFSELEAGPIERAESIEMLRYMEHGIPMGCVPIKAGSKTVDYPEDVDEVEKILRELNQ
jgi:3-deoxy-manno-octulosonate cytidylyltransferase (CMP-KDO synthetase)